MSASATRCRRPQLAAGWDLAAQLDSCRADRQVSHPSAYVRSSTHEALLALGVSRGRIAVAALNPHAGEGSLFGRQDIDVSEPTIAKAVADGHGVVGPILGDTIFVKLRAGQYDAVIAMYHDQGHIPVKLLGFKIRALP